MFPFQQRSVTTSSVSIKPVWWVADTTKWPRCLRTSRKAPRSSCGSSNPFKPDSVRAPFFQKRIPFSLLWCIKIAHHHLLIWDCTFFSLYDFLTYFFFFFYFASHLECRITWISKQQPKNSQHRTEDESRYGQEIIRFWQRNAASACQRTGSCRRSCKYTTFRWYLFFIL